MDYDYGDDLGPCAKDLDKLEAFKQRRRAEKKAERETQAAQQDPVDWSEHRNRHDSSHTT